MNVVGEIATWDHIETAADQQHADLVILARRSRESAIDCWPLLYARPRIKVLAISDTGRGMSLYALRPQEVEFADVSALGLVAAIRQSVADGGG
jgi:hypothetical protein